jgi:ribosomal protein S18 acetylase RimI-like enzyme
MHLREATPDDAQAIFHLYKSVSAVKGGIARLSEEITMDYVSDFVRKSVDNGLIIVCEDTDAPEKVIGEIHGYKNDLAVFRHVLGNLTMVVDPAHQGKKIGRTLLTIYLSEIAGHHPEIGKVELICRESNAKAIQLYQAVGFRIEGRMEMRIRTTAGTYEADIPMGWQNPGFEFY